MAVPQSGTTGRCLVRSRAGRETPVSWRSDSPARASTSAVATTTDGASDKCPSDVLLSRRRRRDADVGDDARDDDVVPARRGNVNRIGAAHQSDFVMLEPHQDTHQEAHQ